jgi:hypothetical protein
MKQLQSGHECCASWEALAATHRNFIVDIYAKLFQNSLMQDKVTVRT